MRSFILALSLLWPAAATAATVTYQPVRPEQRMAFVHIDGVITGGETGQLQAMLAQATQSGKPVAVMLSSRGGDVDEAMAMGRAIRRAGAVTYHRACASSCVFTFLGGVQRYTIGDQKAQLVVHRPQLAEAYVMDPSPGAKAMLDMLRDYIAGQTGSSAFYDVMMTIPFGAPRALGAAEAQNLGVATMVLR